MDGRTDVTGGRVGVRTGDLTDEYTDRQTQVYKACVGICT
jgi:hypothetical protein